MQVIRGKVKGRVIRVPKAAHLAEGQQVLVIPWPSDPDAGREPKVIAEEDVSFVRACRARLARQLESSDADAGA